MYEFQPLTEKSGEFLFIEAFCDYYKNIRVFMNQSSKFVLIILVQYIRNT